MKHKAGCPATGGYGTMDRTCICNPQHPIKLVSGTQFCQYSVLENKLATISENQRTLYDAVDKLAGMILLVGEMVAQRKR